MDTLFLIVACFALGFASAWFGRPMIEALRNAGPPNTEQAEPESDELPPGVVPMDAVPELRKQPSAAAEPRTSRSKTTANVRRLQSHRAALLEFCEQRGLKVEAQQLIEDLDMEMEAK